MMCLFCGGGEPDYRPEPKTDFICSKCVQIMLEADQEQLRRAYKLAMGKGYANKARAIESFLEERTYHDDRKTEEHKRNIGRKKIGRVAGPTRDQLWP